MKDSSRNICKYISLISLLLGIGIWIYYIIFILALSKNTSLIGLAMTSPIGIIGIITGIISKNKKLIILNTIQSLAFPIFFASETYRGNIRID